MSKTKFIACGDKGFWGYDVALNIFLKHLIDAGEANCESNTDWLRASIADWRMSCVPDYGFTLDTNWTAAQKQTFIALAEEACAKLAARESISDEEIVSWPILDDIRIFPCGAKQVLTAPIVELGHAIIALVSGELQDAPKGQIWLYGAPGGRITIGWKG